MLSPKSKSMYTCFKASMLIIGVLLASACTGRRADRPGLRDFTGVAHRLGDTVSRQSRSFLGPRPDDPAILSGEDVRRTPTANGRGAG